MILLEYHINKETHSIDEYLNKICVFSVSDSDNSMDFFNKFLFFVIIKVHVPFGQPCLAGTVLDEDESNLERRESIFTLVSQCYMKIESTSILP